MILRFIKFSFRYDSIYLIFHTLEISIQYETKHFCIPHKQKIVKREKAEAENLLNELRYAKDFQLKT